MPLPRVAAVRGSEFAQRVPVGLGADREIQQSGSDRTVPSVRSRSRSRKYR